MNGPNASKEHRSPRPSTNTRPLVNRPRLALVLGVVGLLAWPFSYAWIPSAGSNPDWVGIVVPAAEWGAITCAIAAIWLGTRARRTWPLAFGAIWAPRVGGLTLGLMAITFLVVAATYR